MEKKEPQLIPVQYVPICEEEEIDLKEIIKTILRYKKFIVIFTLTITLLTTIYVYLQKPIYKITADVEVGYYNLITKNEIIKYYFLDPYYVITYINNKYPQAKANLKKEMPNIPKKEVPNIIEINILNYSNKEAINNLQLILKDIHSQENKKIQSFISFKKQKIKILNNQINTLYKQIKSIKSKLNSTKDPQIYQTLLNTISNYLTQIQNLKLKIIQLKSQISPTYITKTHVIGNIKKQDKPIKPKRKLIITVAFITSLILSIFLIFFIEFIKSLKEEKE